MDKNLEIQHLILKSVEKLSLVQQLKLLDFINSMIDKVSKSSNKTKILQFAGKFDKKDLDDMKEALEDCEQINIEKW